ncbi:MAG: 4Fe-4S dicluster domain-containing protein [Candidatus Desulfatibia sp.]|uniref:4Fe-4S dicluster domain-containing protein n=1 Tax=Candidatus Desulfatibia sp. TaxID=3101189 RepID=UPI002F346631
MRDVFFSEFDPNFKEEVADKIGLESIKPCFTCGSCTGICPVHEIIEDFDPRRIIYKILLGRRKEVLSSDLIWFCCLCNECFFVCPQEVKFSRVATELRKMALAEGLVAEGFLEKLEAVNPYLKDLCRRTLFRKVREGFCGPHTMPCWQKHTK